MCNYCLPQDDGCIFWIIVYFEKPPYLYICIINVHSIIVIKYFYRRIIYKKSNEYQVISKNITHTKLLH